MNRIQDLANNSTSKSEIVLKHNDPSKRAHELILELKSQRYNTTRQQLHYIKQWLVWCSEPENHQHFPKDAMGGISPFPIPGPAFMVYLRECAKRLKSSSIKNMLELMNSFHISACKTPIKSSETKSLLKRLEIRDSHFETVTDQAIPVMFDDLKALIKLHAGGKSLRNLRDLLIMWIGFETMLRESELARIKIHHLKWQPESQHYTLVVKRTKTSLKTEIVYQLSPQCSQTINTLLSQTGTDRGQDYLFQAITKHNKGYVKIDSLLRSKGQCIDTLLDRYKIPLHMDTSDELPLGSVDEGVISGNTIRRAYKSLWLSLGKPIKSPTDGQRYLCWTGHSVRVGGAIELARAGYSLTQILEMGNWKSTEMVLRYIRNTVASDKAMVSFMNDALGGAKI